MKKVKILIPALAIVLILAWLFLDHWSRLKLEEVCAEWPLINRNLSDFSQVFPATSENQSAKTLGQLYGQIHYNVDENVTNKGSRGSDGQKSISDMQAVLREYLKREVERPDDLIEVPDASIVNVLKQNKDNLASVAELLINSDLPVFYFNSESGLQELVPWIGWQVKLNELLLVKALSLQANGHSQEAWTYLQSSSRLAESSFSRPDLLGQMLANAESTKTLLVLRKMANPIPSWAIGWPDQDMEYLMLVAYTREARNILKIAESTRLLTLIEFSNKLAQDFWKKPVAIGLWTRIIAVVAERPYLRLYSAHMIKAWKQMIKERINEGLCVEQPILVTPLINRLPDWVTSSALFKASTGLPLTGDMFNDYWNRQHRLLIYKNGTYSILAAKHARATFPLRH